MLPTSLFYFSAYTHCFGALSTKPFTSFNAIICTYSDSPALSNLLSVSFKNDFIRNSATLVYTPCWFPPFAAASVTTNSGPVASTSSLSKLNLASAVALALPSVDSFTSSNSRGTATSEKNSAAIYTCFVFARRTSNKFINTDRTSTATMSFIIPSIEKIFIKFSSSNKNPFTYPHVANCSRTFTRTKQSSRKQPSPPLTDKN